MVEIANHQQEQKVPSRPYLAKSPVPAHSSPTVQTVLGNFILPLPLQGWSVLEGPLVLQIFEGALHHAPEDQQSLSSSFFMRFNNLFNRCNDIFNIVISHARIDGQRDCPFIGT